MEAFSHYVHEGSLDTSHRTWFIWLTYDLARNLIDKKTRQFALENVGRARLKRT